MAPGALEGDGRVPRMMCFECAGPSSAEGTDRCKRVATALVLALADQVDMAQEVTQTGGLL